MSWVNLPQSMLHGTLNLESTLCIWGHRVHCTQPSFFQNVYHSWNSAQAHLVGDHFTPPSAHGLVKAYTNFHAEWDALNTETAIKTKGVDEATIVNIWPTAAMNRDRILPSPTREGPRRYSRRRTVGHCLLNFRSSAIRFSFHEFSYQQAPSGTLGDPRFPPSILVRVTAHTCVAPGVLGGHS